MIRIIILSGMVIIALSFVGIHLMLKARDLERFVAALKGQLSSEASIREKAEQRLYRLQIWYDVFMDACEGLHANKRITVTHHCLCEMSNNSDPSVSAGRLLYDLKRATGLNLVLEEDKRILAFHIYRL